jgi:hypothetical protein
MVMNSDMIRATIAALHEYQRPARESQARNINLGLIGVAFNLEPSAGIADSPAASVPVNAAGQDKDQAQDSDHD